MKTFARATLALLLAAPLAGQDKILYPKIRFSYSYPGGAVKVERHENEWIKQSTIPKQPIKEFHTWPLPVPETPLDTFTDGPHIVVTKSPKYGEFSENFMSFIAAVSVEDGHAFKIEAGHHRHGAVWGIVHAWLYHEWGGGGEAIPEDFPVWAMYEYLYSALECGKGVWSKTQAYRVSHLGVTGAGEEFIGHLSDYLGPGEDQVERKGLQFRRRNVNFAVEVSVRGPLPVVTWHRGGREGGWRQDPVHGTGHMKEWRKEVNELRASPPPPKQRESEFFCMLGTTKRGMKPAKVSSILDFKGWAARRKKGLRPKHVLGGKGKKRKIAFKPTLKKRVGFVRRKGKDFYFVCKELGLNKKLVVPDDLQPLLEAWVANFPR